MTRPFTKLVRSLAASTPNSAPDPDAPPKLKLRAPGFPSTFAPPLTGTPPAPVAPAKFGNFPPPTAREIPLQSATPHQGAPTQQVANFPKPVLKRVLPGKLSLAGHLASLRISPQG